MPSIERAAIHLTLALLLVVAQFGVLAHSVWHLGDRTGRHALTETRIAVQHQDSESPAQNRGSLQAALCDLHVIMGSVLAGDFASASTPPVITPALPFPREFAASSIARPSLTPPARGPPTLL